MAAFKSMYQQKGMHSGLSDKVLGQRVQLYSNNRGSFSSQGMKEKAQYDNELYRRQGLARDKAKFGASQRVAHANKTRRAAKTQANQMRAAAQQKMAATRGMKQSYTNASNKAVASSQAATNRATKLHEPWRQAGVNALGKLTKLIDSGPGDFKKSVGYEARLEEGNRAMDASSAARGGSLSGRAVKEAMRFGQNFATNDYDNFLKRYYDSMKPLERMSQSGQNASSAQAGIIQTGASQEAGIHMATANKLAAATQYGGEAQAAGTIDAANIMAAQQQAIADRDLGYSAFKTGKDF